MNAATTDSPYDAWTNEPFFCLRQKSSQRFWNGSEWADAPNAKSFTNLDTVLNIARKLSGALDLLVLFPVSTGRLVIPLAGSNTN
jgi:hypothetical protein